MKMHSSGEIARIRAPAAHESMSFQVKSASAALASSVGTIVLEMVMLCIEHSCTASNLLLGLFEIWASQSLSAQLTVHAVRS